MNTPAVRSVMTRMENELSTKGVCLKPRFDLKYMFTVDSGIDDPETKVGCSPETVLSVD